MTTLQSPIRTHTAITPCLWFDDQGEAAAMLYTSIFPGSKITKTVRYGEVGKEIHGRAPGSVMVVEFELSGQPFTALNGGPMFKLSEAVSFQVDCKTQEEVDYYWQKLGEGGDPNAQQCGWLKDQFGLSWQIVPSILGELVSHEDAGVRERAISAMLKMKKLDIVELKRAAGV